MTEPTVGIEQLTDGGDTRGNSYGVPSQMLADLRNIRDVHIATIAPGSTRGGHFHQEKSELLIVIYRDRWSVRWGHEHGAVSVEQLDGIGAAAISVPPGIAHSITNDGLRDLVLVGLSDRPFDSAKPDAVRAPLG